MSFWKRVCNELDYQGVTRKELAYKIDAPIARINRAIERDSQPNAFDAFSIAKVLNVSLEYLLEIPVSNTNGKMDGKEELHQIEMYKKYHSIIDALENLSLEKQVEALKLIKQIVDFRN